VGYWWYSGDGVVVEGKEVKMECIWNVDKLKIFIYFYSKSLRINFV
jgi:hypothetical protein